MFWPDGKFAVGVRLVNVYRESWRNMAVESKGAESWKLAYTYHDKFSKSSRKQSSVQYNGSLVALMTSHVCQPPKHECLRHCHNAGSFLPVVLVYCHPQHSKQQVTSHDKRRPHGPTETSRLALSCLLSPKLATWACEPGEIMNLAGCVAAISVSHSSQWQRLEGLQ